MNRRKREAYLRTWDYEIQLVSVIKGTDADGFPTEQTTEIDVLANRMPVNASEYYQSNKEGYTVEEAFEVNSIEYSGEQSLKFNGDTYRIRRTYRCNDLVELYCERKGVRL